MSALSSKIIPIKDSTQNFLLCKQCLKIKNRSRKFHSLHALKWHLTNQHGDEIKQ